MDRLRFFLRFIALLGPLGMLAWEAVSMRISESTVTSCFCNRCVSRMASLAPRL